MKRTLLLCSYLLSACLLFAQDNDIDLRKRAIAIFAQESFITPLPFYHSFVGEHWDGFNLLDGNISPHFYIADEGKNAYYTKYFMIDLNPVVYTKIRTDFSSPVRTPSFKPGGRLHFFPKKKSWNNWANNYFVGFYHHSNGQDGPILSKNADEYIFDDYEFINEFDLNVYNGDFSDNYFFIGIEWYWKKKKKIQGSEFIPDLFSDGFSSLSTVYALSLSSDVYHFGIEDELIGYLAPYRSNMSLKIIRNIAKIKYGEDSHIRFESPTEKDRFSFNLSFGFGNMSKLVDYNLLRRVNFEFAYSLRIPASSNIALNFRTGYNGQDLYNIYLEDSNIYVMLGVSTGRFLYKEEITEITDL